MKKTFKKIFLLSITLLILVFNLLLSTLDSKFSTVSAHPQPLIVQEFLFDYSKTEIKLTYKLRIDPLNIDLAYPDIDKDKNGETTEPEVRTYTDEILLKNLDARFNNQDLEWEYINSKPIDKLDFRSLEDFLEINLKAKNPIIKETNSIYVKYNKKYQPDDPYGDYFSYEDNLLDVNEIERINVEQTNPSGIEEYSTDFRFKNFNSSETVNSYEVKPGQFADDTPFDLFREIRELSTKLSGEIRSYDFNNPGVFLIAFLILLAAGALHAITPGHGKSMVAAFLVGKKDSKAVDVFILGLSITLAHTAVIFIIGFILISLGKASQASQIVVTIERISAWLFLGLGLILIYNGYKAYKHFKFHQEGGIDDHTHVNKNLKIRNRWDLFYAGIAGGIVPCFDALSILFIFVSLGKTELGLIFVFIFSLGLAGAIIVLGLSLLYGKNKFKLEEKIGPKAEYILPFIAGGIISLFGIFYILSK